jgi:hypothetical protein
VVLPMTENHSFDNYPGTLDTGEGISDTPPGNLTRSGAEVTPHRLLTPRPLGSANARVLRLGRCLRRATRRRSSTYLVCFRRAERCQATLLPVISDDCTRKRSRPTSCRRRSTAGHT